MSDGLIYLDYAATTPVADSVVQAMLPYFCEIFSNPSSKHSCGRRAAKAVSDSRAVIADLLGASTPSEICFTSGASEANNLAIKGVAEMFDEPQHFITTAIEHKSVLNAFEDLGGWDHEVTVVPPRSNGVVSTEDIEDAMRPNTVLVSCMFVNNEIGTIQPICDIADVCKSRGILFHTDATQAFGKIPIDVGDDIDLVSVSAHKLYGPKGAGALYVSDRVNLKCQISGGSQEGGIRSGTLNVPGIVGLSTAAALSCGRIESEWARLKGFEDMLLSTVKRCIPMSYLQGDPELKVPWINNVCFYGADGGLIRDEMGKREICISRTSACSKSGDKSHVLEAIGLENSLQSGAIRISFGSRTTERRIHSAVEALVSVVSEVRKL